MCFVASPEQIAAFDRRCNEPSYSQEAVVVEFTTTQEFIKSVLPPTLYPSTTPTGLISVSTWSSNVCGNFELSSVAVSCVCDGREGYWVLHLIVSESFAITWGRETFGEVKRDGKARLFSNGTRTLGFAERHGTRLIEIEADFTKVLEPNTSEWYDFEVKAFPKAVGSGLEYDPKLITLNVVDQNQKHVQGVGGRLRIRGTKADPLHTIPILSVDNFSYVSGKSDWRVVGERTLCPADEYMPYFVGRHYEDLTNFPAGPGLLSLEETGTEEEASTYFQTMPGCN